LRPLEKQKGEMGRGLSVSTLCDLPLIPINTNHVTMLSKLSGDSSFFLAQSCSGREFGRGEKERENEMSVS